MTHQSIQQKIFFFLIVVSLESLLDLQQLVWIACTLQENPRETDVVSLGKRWDGFPEEKEKVWIVVKGKGKGAHPMCVCSFSSV